MLPEKEPDIRLLLNGGSQEMDAATIPIEFFFSERVIARNPTHVLVYEQDENEIGNMPESSRLGRRYLHKIERGVFFMQVHKGGRHRLMAIALNEKDLKHYEPYFYKNADLYRDSIPWDVKEHWRLNNPLASALVEFSVPSGLFAHRPRKGLSLALWNWTKYCLSSTPRDQCQYRRRIPAALTIFPIMALIWSLGGAAYTLVASLLVFLAGYRPKNIFWGVLNSLRHEVCTDVRKYGEKRVWSKTADGAKTKILLPFAPYELGIICFFAWLAGIAIGQFMRGDFSFELVVMGILIAIVFIILCLAGLVRFCDWLVERGYVTLPPPKAKEEPRKPQKSPKEIAREKDLEYQRWLAEHFSLDKQPSRVDLTSVPSRSPVIHFFRMRYWDIKMLVCKPYSK